jgi:pantoate kinase
MASLADTKADIWTDLPVPISCGFGTSGAGALSTALALSSFRAHNLSLNSLCGVAQRAEITNKTGVGDVVAQAIGGVVIRRQGNVDRIPMPPREISFVIFGQLSTAQIIADKEMMRGINTCGSKALKRLDKRPTFDEFMSLSKEFAYETGLLGGKARDAIETVEAAGGSASMAMLGDAVFAVDPGNALSEFRNARTTRIYNCGAHLLG